jgi:arylsulfatase A-like enzyme
MGKKPNFIVILADDLGFGDLGLRRRDDHQDAEPRQDGRRGGQAHRLLRLGQRLHAVAGGAC